MKDENTQKLQLGTKMPLQVISVGNSVYKEACICGKRHDTEDYS